MTTFKQVVLVDLDPEWIDDILVTAFDRNYGACWYWVGECEEIQRIGFRTETHVHERVGRKLLTEVVFHLPPHDKRDPMWNWSSMQGKVHLNKVGLERAWREVVSVHPGIETARQLNRSMVSGDLDIDAEGADVLVQVALFGSIEFS